MPSTGAVIAGAGASVTGIGTNAWASPGNITASDDTRSTASTNTSTSRWLAATAFDFSSIPDDAMVLGLSGRVEGSYSGGTSVTLTAATLIVGGAAAGTQIAQSQAFTTSDVTYTIDLTPGLSGYLVTAAVIKASTSGFGISVTGVGVAQARIDAMWLTVEYAQPGPMWMRYIKKKQKLRSMREGIVDGG